MSDYEVGYGKPPKRYQIGQPDGPAPGKSSAHRKAEIEAAELAAIVSRDLVQAVHDTVKAAGDDAERIALVRSDTLALLRDVQNRAHGTPKQTIEQDTTLREAPKSLDAFYGAHTFPPEAEDGN